MTRRGNYQKVTMLEDLPDLNEIENFQQSPVAPNKYEKFIRDTHQPGRQSGMMEGYEDTLNLPSMPPPTYQDHNSMAHSSMPHPNMMPPNMPPPPPIQRPSMENFVHPKNNNFFDNSSIIQTPEFFNGPKPVKNNSSELSCVEVADHIENCPICSKFYRNNNTIFLIIIFILSIFCLILLKKVLDICNN